MDIDLRQLREITLRVIDHLIETRKVSHVRLDANYYWTVPRSALFSMESPPAQLDVGSLVDDWGFVRSLLAPACQPVAYQLTEIAPILAAIGERLADELAKDGG